MNGTRQSAIDAKILKDSKPLTAKDVEAVVHDDKVVFTIRKPAHELSGKYQIKLKNDQGEDVKDVNINMQGIFFLRSRALYLFLFLKFVFHLS